MAIDTTNLKQVIGEIMLEVESHIDKQITSSNITGEDAAKIYVGSLGHAINASLQYELIQAQKDSINAKMSSEAQLIAAQKSKTDSEKLLVDAQVATVDAKRASEVSLISKQALHFDSQIALLGSEKLFKDAQKEQLSDSVSDNRNIKAIDALSDIIGMTTNSGGSVPSEQYAHGIGAPKNFIETCRA